MVVPLLVTVINIESNANKFLSASSAIGGKITKVFNDGTSESRIKAMINEYPKSPLEIRRLSRDLKYSKEQDSQIHSGKISSIISGFNEPDPRSLAQKFAKEALKSPKVQQTMKKLTDIKAPRKAHKMAVGVKGSRVKSKKKRKPFKQNGWKKKKRKRHHRRHKNRHPKWRKRGPSKSGSDSKRGRESAVMKRSQEKSAKEDAGNDASFMSNNEVDVVRLNENEYVDSTSIPGHDGSASSASAGSGFLKQYSNESMVAQLMRTTTRDPSKKSPGDQGVEYSDYYSDDDLLQDKAVDRIQKKIAEPSDRFIRQTKKSASYYADDRITGNQAYNQDFDKNANDYGFDDGSVKSDDAIESYPDVKQSSDFNAHPEVYGVNDDISYKDEDSDLDSNNYINTDQPELLYQTSLSNVETDNLDSPDNIIKSELEQSFVKSHKYYKPSYANQYGKSYKMSDDLDNLPKTDDLQVLDDDKDVMEYDKYGDKYSSFQSPLYPQKQDSIVDLPNAMNQPLGKVLKSLGINVISDPSSTRDSELEFNENQNSMPFSKFSAQRIHNPTFSHAIIEQPEKRILEAYEEHRKDEEDASRTDSENDTGLSGLEMIKEDENVGNEPMKQSRRFSPEEDRRRKHARSKIWKNRDTMGGRKNVSATANETKEIANQLLGKIIDELEELKLDRSTDGRREGMPCKLSGTWLTTRAGIMLKMMVVKRTVHVNVTQLKAAPFQEPLFNASWNITGHVPFRRGAPFSLTASNNRTKSLAVFVGACRVCHGIDTITGVWSVAYEPKDCKDLQVAVSTFNDVFRKSKLLSITPEKNNTWNENFKRNLTTTFSTQSTILKTGNQSTKS